MGLVIRNGRAYFLESYRLGDRVTSRCAGTGELALLLADEHRLIRSDRETSRRELKAMRQERVATRRQEQGETRRLRERITLADRIVGMSLRHVTKTVEQTLTALGYHRFGEGTMASKARLFHGKRVSESRCP